LLIIYGPESYQSIHVANSKEMAGWVYSERRDVGSSMLEEVLSEPQLSTLSRYTQPAISLLLATWMD
jgi:hypothetical protein